MTREYETLTPYSDSPFHFKGASVIAQNHERVLLLSNQGSTILISAELLEQIRNRKCTAGLAVKLMQHGFAEIENVASPDLTREPEPSYFIVDLTKKCNFNCIYCFRDPSVQEHTENSRLTDILEYITQYCRRYGKDRIGIQAWGGEPMLQSSQIFKIADYFRKENIAASIEVETNASLITEELAKNLRTAHIHLGISIDGPKMLQDMQRPARNHLSSYAQTMAGIANVKKYYGNDFGVISVITRYSIEHPEELIDHLVTVGIRNMKFNIVRDNRYAREGGLLPELDQIDDFYKRVFQHILRYYERGIRITESTIHTRFENLVNSSRKNCCESSGCTGGRSILSFDYKGDIYPCELTDFEEEKIGSIDDGDLRSLIQKKKQVSLFHKDRTNSECSECPWLFYCRGGCTSRVLYCGKDGIDEVACHINRILYPLISEQIVRAPRILL